MWETKTCSIKPLPNQIGAGTNKKALCRVNSLQALEKEPRWVKLYLY